MQHRARDWPTRKANPSCGMGDFCTINMVATQFLPQLPVIHHFIDTIDYLSIMDRSASVPGSAVPTPLSLLLMKAVAGADRAHADVAPMLSDGVSYRFQISPDYARTPRSPLCCGGLGLYLERLR